MFCIRSSGFSVDQRDFEEFVNHLGALAVRPQGFMVSIAPLS